MGRIVDSEQWSASGEDACRSECLNNCSCVAYGYYSGIECLSRRGDLIDIQKFSKNSADIYLRLTGFCSYDKKKDLTVVISITVIIGATAIAVSTYIFGIVI
ncbi:PAN/Apple domain [Dillenia turbinata]|uniref:PAN/Apple domain n=1 Tax=Dillenia turbinata TaxID=194707 RepID=A0AAN8ZLI9_9MAGN